MVYVIQVCLQPVPSWSCSQAVWHIPLLCIQWKILDDGQRNCPKHVEFYSKIKCDELVDIVGFIIRINHDARSHECQNWVENIWVSIREKDRKHLFSSPFAFKYRNIPNHNQSSYLPSMKMENTECSETSAYTIQTPGNYSEVSKYTIQNMAKALKPITVI